MKNKILLIISACFVGFFIGEIKLNLSFIQVILLSILSFVIGFLIPILYLYNTLMNNNSGKKVNLLELISYKNSNSVTLWIGFFFCIIFIVGGLKNFITKSILFKEILFYLLGICFSVGMVVSSYLNRRKENCK